MMYRNLCRANDSRGKDKAHFLKAIKTTELTTSKAPIKE